jgi:hypothetical protein
MEKGWVTEHEKEKSRVKDSEIIQECLVIQPIRLNRHNVIHNTSINLLPSVT